MSYDNCPLLKRFQALQRQRDELLDNVRLFLAFERDAIRRRTELFHDSESSHVCALEENLNVDSHMWMRNMQITLQIHEQPHENTWRQAARTLLQQNAAVIPPHLVPVVQNAAAAL